MNYYITKDGQPVGPFSIEQLASQGLTPDSLVWNEGMPQWTRAGEVAELQCLFVGGGMPNVPFQAQPPYQQPYQAAPNMPVCPKTWLVESILVTLFCCLPFGIVGIIKASGVSSAFARGDYNGALQASQEAGKWTKIGFILGLVAIVLYFIFLLFFAAGMASL